MSKTESQQQTDTLGSVFQCDFCGNEYLSRVVPYNHLGYPVCPVCRYDHGPKPQE